MKSNTELAGSGGGGEDWESRMAKLDQLLKPIANRPVNITRPGWVERLQARTPSLDETHTRETVDQLLTEVIATYALATDDVRAGIRQVFQNYPSFAWAAALSTSRTTLVSVRQQLILFSIKDQGRDGRDALLEFEAIYQDASNAGLEIASLLREIAAMSSDEKKYGMGSTRDMLLQRCSGR